ncbi:MAG: ABC transporter ATP-binding protein [Rubrivivax sp.]|nr:ABC transporter ATP-binding protein [Rubrivivax sp.]
MTAAALQGEGLTLMLGGRSVVDDVSVAFQAGQWTAVVGPNGAGKSTLLSLLAGLRAPDVGQVWLQGRPLGAWSARARAQALAWLSQQGEADGDIAVRDVVRLGRLPRHGLLGAPDAEDETAVDQAMAATETTDFAARRLSELSGGERQRVLLARALAVRARVLLLDEPTTHLDAPHQRALCRGLRERARGGAAVVSVMHDLTQALGADRLLVLRQGRVLADAAPGDAALHAALALAFGGAFSIQQVHTPAGPRWVAVPAP